MIFDRSTFATKFKELRKQNKWSQKEIAEKLNITQSTVSNYEKGKFTPIDIGTMDKIANLFNVPMSYFMVEDKEFVQVDPKRRVTLSQFESNLDKIRISDMDFINKYMSLTDDQKSVVATLVNGLLK